MKLGFIGAGNMGSAILQGILRSHTLPAASIAISRKHPEKSAELAAQGVFVTSDNRALAYELASQTLIGAARMVLETGEHPGKLKDAVCSPGGTTIEGMFALERGGMRAAVMDAVGAAVEKTLLLSKG